MSTSLIGRRQFLTLPAALLFVPLTCAFANRQVAKGTYAADVGILYEMLTFRLEGTIEETIDRTAEEYLVRADGRGPGIANRVESTGVMRNGRWAPLRSESWFDIRGRQSRTEIKYNWAKQEIEYHARGETFFLRRLRVVDDIVPVSHDAHIDDVMSATLNYADGRWPVQPDNALRTLVVRRRRAENEGPDDVASSYRAEVVPLELKIVPDPSGKPTALFDLSRFSSWAKPSRPAHIVFAQNRRPELITSSMILGTSVTIRFTVV
jgi:hypothetical protein